MRHSENGREDYLFDSIGSKWTCFLQTTIAATLLHNPMKAAANKSFRPIRAWNSPTKSVLPQGHIRIAEVGGYIIDMSEKRHDEVIEYQLEFWRITRLVNQQSDEKIVLFSVRPA